LARRKRRKRRVSYKRNKYLGKRVKDVNKPGLDSYSEARGIADKIVQDYRRGRISYRTAMSRMNLLELIIKKDSDFRGKRKARAYIDKKRKELQRIHDSRNPIK